MNPPERAPQAGASAEVRCAFLDAELEHLRSEDQLLRQEAWRVETYSVATAGAVVAWLATHPVTTSLAWWIPLAIVVAAGLRFGSIMRHLEYRVRVYVATAEVGRLGSEGGWQTFSKRQPTNQALANWLIWILVVVLAMIIGLYGPVLRVAAPAS